MSAAFDALGLETMKVSEGALRHGVLYDLLGRVQHQDMREATVAQFMRRYHVDAAQALRAIDGEDAEAILILCDRVSAMLHRMR